MGHFPFNGFIVEKATYIFTLDVRDKVTFTVNTIQKTYDVPKPKCWLLELEFYFRGNTRAPHKTIIDFKRI